MKSPRIPASRTAAVLILLAGTLVLAPPAAAQHGVHGAGREAKITLPEGRESVRIPFRHQGSHILLDLSVGGSEPLSVILDTGMPMPGLVLIDGDRTRSLDLESMDAQARVGGAGGEGHHVTAKVARGTVSLGGLGLGEMQILTLPPMGHFSSEHDGIIGASLFRNFTVQLDFDRKEMVLRLPGAWSPEKGTAAVPLTLRQGIPYVEARIETAGGGTSEIETVLDLGAGHNISLNATTLEAIQAPQGAIRAPIGRGISGEVLGQVGRVPAVILGGIRVENVVATFPDPEFEHPSGVDSRNGNLGIGLAARFNLTLDYAGRMLYLEPNAGFGEPFEWDMSGMILEPGEDGALAVGEILPGTPAEAAGLKAGDIITEIDGRSIGAGDRETVKELLRRDGAEVTLKYRRGEEIGTKVITLHRRV